MLLDVLVNAHEVVTVEMYELSAAYAFKVEMLAAFVLIFDVLVARAGLAVDDEFADNSRFHELVELAVDSRSSERRALG